MPDQVRHDGCDVKEESLRFLDPGRLVDGELELVLIETTPGNSVTGHAPEYSFQMRVRGKNAGHISLRVADYPRILMYAGHIGYTVLPEYQGNHYAERACRLLLPLSKAHDQTTVWITCNPENVPSRRTCERLGAELVEIVELPLEESRRMQGATRKCRYRVEVG
jgi:predicted acetyltransferase